MFTSFKNMYFVFLTWRIWTRTTTRSAAVTSPSVPIVWGRRRTSSLWLVIRWIWAFSGKCPCRSTHVDTWGGSVSARSYRIIYTNSSSGYFHSWTIFFSAFSICYIFKINKAKSTRSSTLKFKIFLEQKYWIN